MIDRSGAHLLDTRSRITQMGPQPSCSRSAKNPAVVKKIRGDESGLETDMNVEDEEMTHKRLCF